VKYTAKFIATKDEDQLSRFLSTSLGFYGVVAVVVLLVSVVGFFQLDLWFKIPAGLLRSARILFLLAGTSVALAFPLGVFAGALEGLQKFAWLQLSQIGVTLFRAFLIVIALTSGRGLLAIGIITVVTSLLTYLIFTWMALRTLTVRLSLRNIERKTFRIMARYGVFAFAILAAEKLRFQSDAMVIGAFLSSTAITSFSIGSKLVEYSSYTVRGMSQIFAPMSSQFHAVGDLVRLRQTFVAGNRACAFIIFPLCVTLIILGKPIIEAWVGARYLASYSVLVVLVVPRSIYLAQSTSTRILLGMGRHHLLALALLLEGGLNLVLSLLLVRHFGILGVAWGTAIPLACTSLFFLPQHLCRELDIPLRTFLTQAYRVPLALCVPLAGMLWVISHQFPTHGDGVLLQIACAGIVYVVGLAVVTLNGFSSLRSWQEFARALEPK
jgi:O-antigen/teichoic acid export membrane protein